MKRALRRTGSHAADSIRASSSALGLRSGAVWLLCCLVCIASFFCAGSKAVHATTLTDDPLPADGAYGVVTVDLRPDVGDVPNEICVVSESDGPRTRSKLSSLLGRPAAPKEPSDGADELDGEATAADAKRWFQIEGRVEKDAHGDALCTYDGRCVPRVRLPRGVRDASELHMACVSDSLGDGLDFAGGNTRLIVLMLEHLGGSPPVIGSVRLAGGIASIGVHLDLRRVVVTARSLGGDYAPHDRSYRAEVSGLDNKLVSVPLSPLCRWVDLRLDGARFREGDGKRVRLELDGAIVRNRRCRVPRAGKSELRVLLPRTDGGGRLDVSFDDGDGRRRPIQTHSVRWDGRWPEEGDRLEATHVTFSWRRPDCIYPRDQCPTAELEGGVRCTPTDGGDDRFCRYSCSSRGAAGEGRTISTPIAVTFEKRGPTQRWTDALQRPGQVLSSFVERERIYLRGDVSDWKTDRPGNRVTHIEFIQSDGVTRRYAVTDRARVTIVAPEASCEALAYRVIGDRTHKEAAAQVRDGRIIFQPPEDSALRLTYHLSLLAGAGWSLLTEFNAERTVPQGLETPLNFVGSVAFGFNLRSNRPSIARLSWDVRVSFLFGSWGRFLGPQRLSSSLDDRGAALHTIDERFQWARLLLGGAMVVDLFPSLAAGIGIDVGGGFPLQTPTFQPDPESTFYFVTSPTVDARFALKRWLYVVFEARALLGETIVRYPELDLDVVENEHYRASTIAFSAGVRGVF